MNRLPLIIILALAALPITLRGENYFAQGMEWYAKTEYINSEPPSIPQSYVKHLWVDGDTIVDGVSALKVYGTDPRDNVNLVAVIRSEGDKVYTLHNYDSNEWYLAYDFSLQPGEECTVYHFDAIRYRPKPQSRRIVCVGYAPSEEYGGYPVMQFRSTDYTPNEFHSGIGEWLIGVGNTASVTFNYFTDGLVGGGGRLLSAKIDGIEICHYVSDNITDAEQIDDSMRITQTGDNTITIANISPNSQVCVYNTAGALVRVATATDSSLDVCLDHKGIYIVKAGAAAKIISLM